MDHDHHQPSEHIDDPGSIDPELDELITAVFDDTVFDDTVSDAAVSVAGVTDVPDDGGDVAGPSDGSGHDEQLTARVHEIAAALRTVEASKQVDHHVSAALEVWDEMMAARSDEPAVASIASVSSSPRRSRRGRSTGSSRWSFTPPVAWLGAAAAAVLVIGGAIVVLDRSPSGGDDQTLPAALESADEDEAGMSMFAMEEPGGDAATDGEHDTRMMFDAGDDADLDASADSTEAVSEVADVAEGDAMIASDAPDVGVPWLGEIDADLLDQVVAGLLPGVSPALDAPCADGLERFVAEGLFDGRPVLIGTGGAEALAIDAISCELLVARPLADDADR